MDSLIQGMNADGFNGDTMGLVPKEFFDVSMGLKHPVAIEPEGGGQATATVAAAEGGGNPAEWDTMGCAHTLLPFPPLPRPTLSRVCQGAIGSIRTSRQWIRGERSNDRRGVSRTDSRPLLLTARSR